MSTSTQFYDAFATSTTTPCSLVNIITPDRCACCGDTATQVWHASAFVEDANELMTEQSMGRFHTIVALEGEQHRNSSSSPFPHRQRHTTARCPARW